MAFKKFEGGRRSTPAITLRMSGEIAFNKGAREAYLNGEMHAVLFYDDEENKIGIEPVVDENAEGARPIRMKDSPGATISAKVFFDAFNIPYSSEKRTLAGDAISIEEQMIVLQL